MGKTLTVAVASFNEENNIENTFNNILDALGDKFEDYEIILFDDCSTDRTGSIIDQLAAWHPKVRAIHNHQNLGFGYVFNKGLELAKSDYFCVLPGDNEILGYSIKRLFDAIGTADIIIPFTMNAEIRPRIRAIVSHLYTFILNLLFRCELKYYNGPAVHKISILRNMPLRTTGFAFQSSVLVRLLRMGYSFVEVEMFIRKRGSGRSKAFKLRNISSVINEIIRLYFEVEVFNREKYKQILCRESSTTM